MSDAPTSSVLVTVIYNDSPSPLHAAEEEGEAEITSDGSLNQNLSINALVAISEFRLWVTVTYIQWLSFPFALRQSVKGYGADLRHIAPSSPVSGWIGETPLFSI